MRGGRGIQSRGLSTVKHKELKMADEGEKIGEADGTLCRPL